MKSLLFSSSKMGLATLAWAYILQKGYEVTDFYPPNPVFWFFMGFNASFALGLLDKYVIGSSASTLPPSAGFGEVETLESIDEKIQQYQDNIAGLKKILRVGSPQGKQAATAKLQTATANLNKFIEKRTKLTG